MQNFFRSLRYLWPYRRRLAVALVCVLIISVLWGGGLGMLVPGSKILISEEGLHGWAYNSLVNGKLNVRVIQRISQPGSSLPAEGNRPEQPLTLVLDVIDVEEESQAHTQGLRSGHWLVGMDTDGDGQAELLRGDVLARTLSEVPAGRQVDLLAMDTAANQPYRLTLTTTKTDWSARQLGKVARAIPEPQNPRDRFMIFLGLLVIALVLTYLRDICRFIQEFLVETVVNRGIMDIRAQCYHTVLRLPMSYFAEKGVSDSMSRFIQDTGELGRGQVTLFGKTLVEPAKAIGALAMAMMISWKLTLLAMVAGPPSYWLIRKFGKRMKRASRRALESWADMIAVLEETLNGIRVVKAYTMEGAERRRFFRNNRALLKQQNRMARIDAATAPTIEALGVTAAMGASALAGYWVLTRDMTPESFIALMGCLAALFDPVRKLAKVATRFQRAEAAATRVFELMDQPVERVRADAPKLPPHSESIELRDVSFRYPNANEDALRDINLTVPFGEHVAIVGPNGCGKTTLVSLLPRLIDPSAGQVLIDGVDTAGVSLRSLRGQIGIVTQETVIFRATIAENISYGLRRASRQAVLDAANKAFVNEFADELSEGFDALVGEKGSTLSGGQRQRIAIARAILRDPAILIFDEATSQVDAHSEQRIHEAMQQFMAGRTTLMIAHRFATIRSADRIVVMDAGQIVDIGPHEELVERCELYAHLYKTQFSDS